MSIKDEVFADIEMFLQKMDELGIADKRALLRNIFDKHFTLYQSDLILNSFDLVRIKDHAVQLMSFTNTPTKISGKSLDSQDLRVIRIVEGAIHVLNEKQALRRLPKFDVK